jgi:hypothetical protein
MKPTPLTAAERAALHHEHTPSDQFGTDFCVAEWDESTVWPCPTARLLATITADRSLIRSLKAEIKALKAEIKALKAVPA